MSDWRKVEKITPEMVGWEITAPDYGISMQENCGMNVIPETVSHLMARAVRICNLAPIFRLLIQTMLALA